jgi:hypothetical protein
MLCLWFLSFGFQEGKGVLYTRTRTLIPKQEIGLESLKLASALHLNSMIDGTH